MAQAKTTKFYRTFSKGLITEAGYLTYPENSSSDELNTILSRKGNRSRRLGVEYEDDFNQVDVDITDKTAVNEFVWNSVNNDPDVVFLCLQSGTKIFFFQMTGGALSGSFQPFLIDLNLYKIPTATVNEFSVESVDMSAGSGYLFIAHRFMDPISVEYVPATDTLIVIPIVIQVRDFEGVYDRLANDEEPPTLSAEHHYNLLNQGWVAPGTRPVDISTPTYPGTTPGTGGGVDGGIGTGSGIAPSYYDPYTGETVIYRQNVLSNEREP